ncbi:MAG: AMP-binding protein [Chitinispirillaceae bacterium]|nr:AMP-binding protein [Chitinispirillaceae bacterium]
MKTYTYIELLYESINKHKDLPCLHIKRNGVYESWTYNDFCRDLNKLTSVLVSKKITKGKNCIVIGENSPEWIIAYHSIMLSGACIIPIDPNFPASEIESITLFTKAEIVFCSRIYLDFFRVLKNNHSFIKEIVLLEKEVEGDTLNLKDYLSSGDDSFNAFSTTFDPEDPAAIIFTSGTTGKPKGVILSQKNLTAVGLYAVPRMKVTEEDTVCGVLPFHHVFGCAASIIGPLVCGMDIVCIPQLKGPLIIEALKEQEVTYLPAVPKLLQLFYEGILFNVKKKGVIVRVIFTILGVISDIFGGIAGVNFKRKLFSSVHKGFGGKLRLIISGGASLEKRYWKGFRRLGFDIVEGYGLTETFGPITVCPKEKPKLGSVGPALPENEIYILNPDSSGIGEVLLRGICVFKGYYQNDELTKEVFDSEGWFHTGDLGKLDKEGYLFLYGRKKDVIVLGSGKNVYPDELEEYYVKSDLIEEIGIFGIKQDNKEIVAAVIVPSATIRKTKTIVQVKEIISKELSKMGQHQPSYRRISDFVISYTPLPRTTTRKIKKNELKEIFISLKSSNNKKASVKQELSVIETELMKTSEYKKIANFIIQLSSSKKKIESITPRSHLEIDIGLDSLDRVELISFIEKEFGLDLPEETLNKIETLGDMVNVVKDSFQYKKK